MKSNIIKKKIALIHFNKFRFGFKLDSIFINKYKEITPRFGFNGLGEFVYKRTYSRLIEEEFRNEEWFETVQRVVEGTMNMLESHKTKDVDFDKKETAEKMFDKIFNFKFLPPGRGIWAMGTKITEGKKLFAALNNCAFVSTKPKNLNVNEIIKPYLFLMDSSMLGIGVGFDTKATEMGIMIYKPINSDVDGDIFKIEDSREGWVNSVSAILKCYFKGGLLPKFDYSEIRPAGMLLKTFGGKSSGYQALEDLHKSLIEILNKNLGDKSCIPITSRIIVDIMNLIGKSVVAGNIRRSAEIALGDCNDDSFINLKNYAINPDRESYGWVSNNSVYADIGMNYNKIQELIKKNGEPGILWLDNMRKYSRMVDDPDWKDINAQGGNPCLEQTLESYEMCCLVETFPNKHDNVEEFLDTLKYAFLYAKIVTLGMTSWEETNEIIKKNRRIGVSMTGIAQFISRLGLNTLKLYCEEGYKFLNAYDKCLSESLGVNLSIKKTSIKPSGTVSLLGGATPGLHLPINRFYIRRVRVKSDSGLLKDLKNRGYHIEADVFQPESTMIVSFPIDVGEGVKTLSNSSMYEQLNLAAFLQKYWADNQVSCTITFDAKKEGDHIATALDYYQYNLKGISFLPSFDNKTPYPQMPYEEISKEVYDKMIKNINFSELNKSKVITEDLDREADKFCDGDKCIL